jgi:hypothetical protein
LIEHAAKIGNVAEACRVFGGSRKSFYEWLKKAEVYGLSALLPRERRKPCQPNSMTSEEVAMISSEAIARPTLGPPPRHRQGAGHRAGLADRRRVRAGHRGGVGGTCYARAFSLRGTFTPISSSVGRGSGPSKVIDK